MRILKILFTWLMFAATLAVVGYFIGREVLLLMASSQIDRSISELRAISRNSAQYASICRDKGVPASINAISQLRLRFTSPTEYSTEVVCTQFDSDPVLVRANKLPPMVTKKVGSAGIIFGDQPSGVVLVAFGRERSIGLKSRVTSSFGPHEDLGVWPASTCGGYGFMCCDDVTQQGQGSQYPAAMDCPRSCFNSCVARPVVLSFSTDPVFDYINRMVPIKSGENVAFSYQASLPGKASFQGILDFGDGQTQTVTDTSNLVTHQYSCGAGTCSYKASIRYIYNNTVESVPTSISSVTVVVTP